MRGKIILLWIVLALCFAIGTEVLAKSTESFFNAPKLRRSRSNRRKFTTQAFNCFKCSQHGDCSCANTNCTEGSCVCHNNKVDGFWKGENCDDCVLGYAGPKCTIQCQGGSCNACNGNGVCLQGKDGDGSCSCFNNDLRGHWTGDACDKCAPKYFGAKCRNSCPGVTDEDGQECHGRGKCLSETGICECEPGWGNYTGCANCDDGHYGENCQFQCLGYNGEKPCSGHGRCNNGTSGDGTCTCDEGYGTSDCSRNCPNMCSGRGECLDGANRTAACICTGNWAPPDCSECIQNKTGTNCQIDCKKNVTSANGDGTICSDAGTCSHKDGEAICNCVDGYVGSWCQDACPGTPPCSGHGSCTTTYVGENAVLQCVCANSTEDGFWRGETCDTCQEAYNNSLNCKTECPVGPNGQICSGHGVCREGRCECVRNLDSTDYCGATCEQESLYSGVKCSKDCKACERIYCPKQYYYGQICENKCPGLNFAETVACSGHGFCDEGILGTGKCTCVNGYTGTGCQNACPRNPASTAICSGPVRGTCTTVGDKASCLCNDGFAGASCELQCPIVSGKVCAGHGTCNAETAKCLCSANWVGKSCNVPCLCNTRNGKCDENVCFDYPSYIPCQTCICDGNFTGMCDRCLSGTQGIKCEGECINGATVGTACVCDPYYATSSCGKRCANDTLGVVCGGHGKCMSGNSNSGDCKCDSNYYGAACTNFCTREICTAEGLVNPQCNLQTGKCECLDGNSGHFSSEKQDDGSPSKCDLCAKGFWGPSCTERCECSGHGSCDMNTGECNCYNEPELGHWRGTNCEQCAEGFIGETCERKSVLITRLVGRNITRKIGAFERTDTLSIGIEDDRSTFGSPTTALFAGGTPLGIFDISGENIEYMTSTRDQNATYGCENDNGEVAYAFSALYDSYFLMQPTANCTPNRGFRLFKWNYVNDSILPAPMFLATKNISNPLEISFPEVSDPTNWRVISAVSQVDEGGETTVANEVLIFLIAEHDPTTGKQVPGSNFFVKVDLSCGIRENNNDVCFAKVQPQLQIVTDIALSPLPELSGSVQIIAVSGSSALGWDTTMWNLGSLTFYFDRASIRDRVHDCFPPQVTGTVAGPCTRCTEAEKINFFGESLVIAMAIGDTTSLIWLNVLQHAPNGTQVSVFDETQQVCIDGSIYFSEDGIKNIIAGSTTVLLQTFASKSCLATNGQFEQPCDGSRYFVMYAPSELRQMGTTSMVVDLRPNMPAFEPESGVAYVALRDTGSENRLSVLTKYSLRLDQFGLYGIEELRLTSDNSKNDINEVFTAMAIAKKQRILYAVASGVSRIRIVSFLLYEVHRLVPNIADQRGGTNITVSGIGFSELKDFSISCLFEEVGSDPPTYIPVPAFNISYNGLVCTAPAQNTTSLAGACKGQKVEVSLYNESRITQSKQALQRVQRPFLLKKGVSPDRGSMNTEQQVTVLGAGFVKSEYSQCKFYSDNVLSTQVLYSSVKYISPNEVACTQYRALEASFDRSYLDISSDGQLYSVDTPPEYQIVGKATNIYIRKEEKYQTIDADNFTFFSVSVWVVDSQSHELGSLDTERRRISVFSNVSESGCDQLTGWRRENDGFPWPPCRNISLNSTLWSGGVVPTTTSNFTKAQEGNLNFNTFYFFKPRVGRVVISFFAGNDGSWRTNMTITIAPGKAWGLAIANLDDFGDKSGARSKFYVQRQSPLSQISIIVVDQLGNVIETNVKRYPVTVLPYYVRDDTTVRVEQRISTPIFRIEGNRITFPDIYLEFIHGVSHYLEFQSPGLRPVTTPAIRTQTCSLTEYKVPLKPDCLPCPPLGAVCNGTENITVLEGYWRSNGSSTDIYECKGGPSVCLGSAAANDTCAQGHTGPMCSLCAKGYGKSGATACTKCENEDTTIAFVVLIALAGLCFVLGWITITLRKDEVTEVSIIARTVVNHMQAAGELGEFSTQWSPFLKTLFAIQGGASSFSVSGVQALDCMLKQTESTYTSVFTIYMSLPLVAVGLGVFVFAVVRILRLTPVITKQLREEIDKDIEALGPDAKTAVLLHRYPLYMVLITTMCVTMFSFYQTLITQSTSVLKCKSIVVGYEEVRRMQADGSMAVTSIPQIERWMLVDMSFSCDTSQYNTLYTAALIFAVVYGFGIPVAFVFGYKFVNARIAKPELTKLMFTFLIGGYKENLWFWQAVIMIRKMVLVLVIVFIDNRQLQSYCGMWAMSGALILQIWFNPNEKSEHNLVEAISLALITITLNLSLLYFWPDMPDVGKDLLTAILILITLGAVLIFAYFLYQPGKDTLKETYDEILEAIREFTTDKQKRKAEKNKPRFHMPEYLLHPNDGDEDDHVASETQVRLKSKKATGFQSFNPSNNTMDSGAFEEVEMNEISGRGMNQDSSTRLNFDEL